MMTRNTNIIVILMSTLVLHLLPLFLIFHAEEDDSATTTTTTCLFVDDDGSLSTTTTTTSTTEEFEAGEPVGAAFETRCGTWQEYPCFCAPTLERQVYCPYCAFVNGTGDLHCATDGETITFPDGSIDRICSCQFLEDDPAAEPIRNCATRNRDDDNDGNDGDDNTSNNEGLCVLPDDEGNDVIHENGDPIFLIPGACGDPEDWPSFCLVTDNQGGGFDIEYPYCVFNDAQNGEIICSANGGTVSYTDGNGEAITCTCTYSTADGPETDCVRAVESQPSNPTSPPVSTPTLSPTSQPLSGATYDVALRIPVWSTIGCLVRFFFF